MSAKALARTRKAFRGDPMIRHMEAYRGAGLQA